MDAKVLNPLPHNSGPPAAATKRKYIEIADDNDMPSVVTGDIPDEGAEQVAAEQVAKKLCTAQAMISADRATNLVS